MNSSNSAKKLVPALLVLTLLGGCASSSTSYDLATPTELAALDLPVIPDNSGAYMSPITSDNVPAEWVDNSINASIGAGVGSAAGSYIGSKALEHIPFFGGMLGSQVGGHLGREAAISAAGGEEFMKESSDLSFNNLNDLAVYLYVNYGENPNYPDVLEATSEIYTDLKTTNISALRQATINYRYSLSVEDAQ